jgi:hypothetical protein
MGRFDALTHLEEDQPPKTSSKQNTPRDQNDFKKASQSSQASPPPLIQSAPSPQEKAPEIMNSRIHENPLPYESFQEKPQKYSTLLYGDTIKRIKLYAAEQDMKDYEVIEKALSTFFDKLK